MSINTNKAIRNFISSTRIGREVILEVGKSKFNRLPKRDLRAIQSLIKEDRPTLYNKAKVLNIKGRSKLKRKAQLISSIYKQQKIKPVVPPRLRRRVPPPIPPKPTPSKANTYKRFLTVQNKFTKRLIYESSASGLTPEDMTKAITNKSSGKPIINLTFRFMDPSTKRFIHRSLPKDTIKNQVDLLSWLSQQYLFVDPSTWGSDVSVEYSEIDFSYFEILVEKRSGGADLTFDSKHSNKKVKVDIVYTFKVHNFQSKDNNCLLEILRNVCDVKTSSNKIRGILNLPTGDIDVKDIPVIEKYFNKTIGIVGYSEMKLFSKNNGTPNDFKFDNIKKFKTEVTFEDRFIYGDDNSDIFITLRDSHYSLIVSRVNKKFCPISGLAIRKSSKQAKMKEIIRSLLDTGRLIKKQTKSKTKSKSKSKKPRKRVYWFFDYETVYDKCGYLKPYSVACVKGEYKDGKFRKQRTMFNCSNDCNKLFLKFLFKHCDTADDNILIGFNNSRFDNFILLDLLLRMDLIKDKSVFITGNSILDMKFHSFRTIDLCRFVNDSLKRCCENFGCGLLKEEFSHEYIQDIYRRDEGNFFKNIKHVTPKIESYNIRDCTALAELFFKVSDCFKDLMKVDMQEKMTLGQCGLSRWTETNHGTCAPQDLETWEFCRSAIVAGRSEIFQTGHFEGKFQSLDVKSLYPYVMLVCAFPIGQEIKTDKYVEGKLGIYDCIIKKQPKDNIIPKRSKDKPLNWKYEGEISCRLTSVDIECIKEFDGVVEINEGVYWEESSTDVFKDYIKPFKDEKTKQDQLKSSDDANERKLYNPSYRQFCKLAMNCLSGKVNQRIFTSQKMVVTTQDEYEKQKSKLNNITLTSIGKTESMILEGDVKEIKYNPKKAKPCHLGVFIYSHARTHMYRSVISKCGDNKYAMDTDSIHVPCEFIKELKQERGYGNYFEGDQFGDFEKEINFDTRDVYYIAPKCYGLFGETKTKMRFKGVSRRDKFLMDMNKEDFEKLNTHEKCELFKTLKPALSEDLYKKLTGGETVTIVCSQLKKVINDKNGVSYIKQVFMYKQINPVGEIKRI